MLKHLLILVFLVALGRIATAQTTTTEESTTTTEAVTTTTAEPTTTTTLPPMRFSCTRNFQQGMASATLFGGSCTVASAGRYVSGGLPLGPAATVEAQNGTLCQNYRLREFILTHLYDDVGDQPYMVTGVYNYLTFRLKLFVSGGTGAPLQELADGASIPAGGNIRWIAVCD